MKIKKIESNIETKMHSTPKGRKLIFKFYRTFNGNMVSHECKLLGLTESDVEILYAHVSNMMKKVKQNLKDKQPTR